ncbi:MAG: tetratricopeptide repeat protein, partial [Candidatus Symbiothrix sp.]|nr:tetratricopeptide repeat protein [Candidatus Symbiothrix sp.]
MRRTVAFVSLLLMPCLSMTAQSLIAAADSLYGLYTMSGGAEQIRLANEISELAYRREVVKHVWTFTDTDANEKIRARVFNCMSAFALANGNYSEAKDYAEESLRMDEKRNDLPTLADDYLQLATVYDRINQIDNMISCLKKSIEICRQTNNAEKESETLYQLGKFYLRKNRDDIGIETLEKALSTARSIKHKKVIADALGTMGEFYLKTDNAEKGLELIAQSLEVSREIGTPQLLEAGLCRMGMAQMKVGEYVPAEKNLLEALKISENLEDKEAKAFDLMTLGDLYNLQNRYEKAHFYYMQSVERCEELQHFNLLSVIYDKMYQLHREKNPALSLEWLEKGILVDDSLYNLEMHDQISAFQAQYETEKKEIRIASLEEEKRLVLWLGIAGVAVMLVALAALFFAWRWTIQKKRKAELQVKQFEQEKQLIATQAVLDGETQERIRLARDLHDGLGSLLTAAKLNLNEMKKGMILAGADVEQFHTAIDLIDESMHEMRRVAHHLMPESLNRCGLKVALSDFCDNISIAVFKWYGNETRFDYKIEVVIYRVVHELVNNAMKHAAASRILLQIIQEDDRIAFTVQDDGKGFDPTISTGGMGIQNTRDR